MSNQYTLIGQLELSITRENQAIEEMKKEVEKNYLSAFEWGLFYNIYYRKILVIGLSSILEKIIKQPDLAEMILKDEMTNIQEDLLYGRFTQQSTSEFSNMAYLAKKEVKADLFKRYKSLLQLMKQPVSPLPVK